jgi:PPOX class probable F420-dependent enzyme
MNLSDHECRVRLAAAHHAVLATRHPERGVDAVPVVYALVGSQVVLPVDSVKAKRRQRLRRLDNLAADDRCVLLVEHYDDDWAQLWWVRVHARSTVTLPSPHALTALGERFPAYRQAGTIEQTIVLTPTAWYGWQA